MMTMKELGIILVFVGPLIIGFVLKCLSSKPLLGLFLVPLVFTIMHGIIMSLILSKAKDGFDIIVPFVVVTSVAISVASNGVFFCLTRLKSNKISTKMEPSIEKSVIVADNKV